MDMGSRSSPTSTTFRKRLRGELEAVVRGHDPKVSRAHRADHREHHMMAIGQTVTAALAASTPFLVIAKNVVV
jgi:hypothetical protein